MASTSGWCRVLVAAAAVGGCARENPFFDDGATDGVEGTTTSIATSATATSPGTSSTDSATSLTGVDTDPVTTVGATEGELTSDSVATTYGSSEESAVSDTEACTAQVVDAPLDADAFLVEGVKCTACADSNYGATAEYELFGVDGGSSYYVVRLHNFPSIDGIEAVTLYTNIVMLVEGTNVMLEVHEFWPGCDWAEGTHDGPMAEMPDGITFTSCDPVSDTLLPGGSPEGAIGAAVADPVMLGAEAGLVALEIPLDAAQIKTWLENGGDSLVLHVETTRGVVAKPAREAADSGGFELAFDVCF